MTTFVQLHLLVSYPPSNLNRDDLGRPKTAKMGGRDRIRVSSQSLKRAWRTSNLFQSALAGHVGTRTKKLGVEALDALKKAGVAEAQAKEWAQKLTGVYGKPRAENLLETETLVHVSPAERASLDTLIARLAAERRAPTDVELDTLLHEQHAVDIAMFGRMVAHRPQWNEDAAVQVAHAVSVHAAGIEDDYFTAVDDLNKGRDETGAGHVGEAGFAAAVLYLYLCVDRDRLEQNLGGDATLTTKALAALVESTLTVGPSGKQNSFASRAYVHYALAEKGPQQPRSLSLAFLRPVDGTDYGRESVARLQKLRDNMEKVYGPCAEQRNEFNVLEGSGTKAELIAFASEA
ncbi:MAG: type I-E CRISPR-associated protein Cas7/Cse4/CasC [Rubrivivax sp.]|nr:type I-E CRISPR-associated protein Cas7/Cse4/CasC [Rubrivivax sp.]